MKIAIAFVVLGIGSAVAQSCPQGTARIATSYGSYCGTPQVSAAQTTPAQQSLTQQASAQQSATQQSSAQQSSGNTVAAGNTAQTCPQGTSRIVTSYGSYCGIPQAVQTAKTEHGQLLENQDILDLIKSGLSADIITAKIRVSSCSFDTSPAALKNLKDANVPDAVILAMVQAPVARPSQTSTTAAYASSSIAPVR